MPRFKGYFLAAAAFIPSLVPPVLPGPGPTPTPNPGPTPTPGPGPTPTPGPGPTPSPFVLPAAVTNMALTELARAAAFKNWIRPLVQTGELFYANREALKLAMGVGPQAPLVSATLDPRWDAANNQMRGLEAGLNSFVGLSIVGGIYLASANPTGVHIQDVRIDRGNVPGKYYSIQRGASPATTYPINVSQAELIGALQAANDGGGAWSFFRTLVRNTGGDGFKAMGNSTDCRFELSWIEAGGQGDPLAHADGAQLDASTNTRMVNCVIFNVAATDDSQPPAFPQYTTNTYGPTNAIIGGPRQGNRQLTEVVFAGNVMNHGGWNQIGFTSNAGEIVRNITIAHNIGCAPEFRLAVDSGMASIYPTLDVPTNGVFENIGFFDNVMPDGSPMLYKDADVTGIWRYNPDTLSDATRARWIEGGLLNSLTGLPNPGMVRNYSASYQLNPLTLSHNTVNESIMQGGAIATVQGVHAGSQLELVDSAGGRVALVAGALVRGATAFDYETATSATVTIRETLEGAVNSPRQTTLTLNVTNTFEQPNLSALSISPASITMNQQSTIAIVGATPGSLITGTVPVGMTLNSGARTITGTPVVANASFALNLTEALNDSENSPRTSNLTLAVQTGVVSIPYTLFYDFEGVGGANSTTMVVSQHTGSRKLMGTAGLALRGNGTNANMSVNGITTTTVNFTNFERLLYCVDIGEVGYNTIQVLFPEFWVGAVSYGVPGTTPGDYDLNIPYWRGKVWHSYAFSGLYQAGTATNPSVQSLGTTAKEFRFRARDNTRSRGVDAVVDAAILHSPGAYRPTICLTMDDLFLTQRSNLQPELTRLGLVGTIFECSALIGGVKMTQTMINEMRASGNAICLDSGPSSNSLTSYGTLANAVAQLKAQRTALVEKYGDAEAGDFFCYANGASGIRPQAFTYNFSISGSTLTCLTGNAAQNYFCRGQRVFNGSTLIGTVVGVNFPNQIILDTTPGDTPSVSLTVHGFLGGLTVVANGTTTITVSGTNSDKAFAGLDMVGPYTPAGAKVVAVAGNTLTMSHPIPAECTRADFPFLDGEWWPTKVMDALLAEGFKFGRLGASGGGFTTAYGIDPRNLLAVPGLSLVGPDTSFASHHSQMQTQVLHGRDQIFYIHDVPTAHMAGYWTPMLEAIATLRDQGKVDVLTLPQYYAKLQTRGAFA